MTKKEFDILEKHKRRTIVSTLDTSIVQHLTRLGFMVVDPLYETTIRDIKFRYALTTEAGLALLPKKHWYNKMPILKLFFK